jgi:hypothetical protein
MRVSGVGTKKGGHTMKPRNTAIAITIVTILISGFLGDDSSAAEWSVESFTYGFLPSMKIDSSGTPHVAFYDGDYLACATKVGEVWNIELVDSRYGHTGQYCSLQFDSEGLPGISYIDFHDWDHARVMYACKSGESWVLEEVATVGFCTRRTSLDYLPDDTPCISYYDWDSGENLMYATREGGYWSSETVDSEGNVGEASNLVVGSDGFPRIAYFDNSNSMVKFARFDARKWVIESVGACRQGSWEYYISMDLDDTDTPFIAYRNPGGGLNLAFHDGMDWQIEDMVADSLDFLSMALDEQGCPHIAAARMKSWPVSDDINLDDGRVYYLVQRDDLWTLEEVTDDFGDTGVSIALDPASNAPAIAYEGRNSNGDLRFARRESSVLEVFLEDCPDQVRRKTTGSFTAGVRNTGDEAGSFDFAEMIIAGPVTRSHTLYDGTPVTLQPGKALSTIVSQYVPGKAPPGMYTVTVIICFEETELSRDSFDVEVIN